MAKIIQRKIGRVVANKTQRTMRGRRWSSTPYTFLPQYKKIENRVRSLECCIFDTYAKKSTTK